MNRKKNVLILVLSILILILASAVVFFLNDYRVLKLANFVVEFPDNQNLSAKLYSYSNTEYVLVVTEKVTHKTNGFFLGFYEKDNFVGIASFDQSKYVPFMSYALTGMNPGIEPTSFMGRFDADVDTGKGRITIFVKGVHPEAKDWLPESEAKDYLIYHQKFILVE